MPWWKLFSQPVRPLPQTPVERWPHRSRLEAELLAAAMRPVPDTWRTLEDQNGDHRFTLRFPPTWIEGTTPDRTEHVAIHPPSARLIQCGGKPMISPCVTVLVRRGGELRDDALLDRWIATRGQWFQGFVLRESVKMTLDGIRALAMFHDFTLGHETWSCLMVLRVAGNTIWYADGSGLTTDLASVRGELLTLLASMKIDAGEGAEPDSP